MTVVSSSDLTEILTANSGALHHVHGTNGLIEGLEATPGPLSRAHSASKLAWGTYETPSSGRPVFRRHLLLVPPLCILLPDVPLCGNDRSKRDQ
jgi:hypothetical protein